MGLFIRYYGSFISLSKSVFGGGLNLPKLRTVRKKKWYTSTIARVLW